MVGLFYIVRLLGYQSEAKQKSDQEYQILHRQFTIMEKRLWWAITTPSMYLTVLAGLVMLYEVPALLTAGWMHVKLAFVLALVAYHFVCQRILFRLRDELNQWSSQRLRIWNEVATILLFAIVFVVVLKSALSWIFGVLGILVFSIVLMMAVRVYKRFRAAGGDR